MYNHIQYLGLSLSLVLSTVQGHREGEQEGQFASSPRGLYGLIKEDTLPSSAYFATDLSSRGWIANKVD